LRNPDIEAGHSLHEIEGSNMFTELIKHWACAAKSLNISGLEEVITKSLIVYIASHYPQIDCFTDALQLNALPIYS